MKSLTDTFTMANDVKIPCVGYGTWQAPDDETTAQAVKKAIENGYRHIDTAAAYGNEKTIGKVIRECGVDRKDLFITSKLWNTERGYEKTKAAFQETLNRLGLEYLDLYLIHWPANKKQFENWKEINAETWRAFEELYREKKIRAIGVSNFLPHHIEALKETATILPMVNQIEFHPGFLQLSSVEYCKNNHIVVEGWSPLGNGSLLEHEDLKRIAAKYHKTVAQVCIRFALQHQVLPLPKSMTESRIIQNADIFDFELEDEDMKFIETIKQCGGLCTDPDSVDF